MAAPTVRGFGTLSAAEDMVPAITATAPTRVAGDLLILFCSSRLTTTAITESGGTYTQLYEESQGTTNRHAAFWRIATNDANDNASWRATNNQDGAAVIVAITVGTHGVTQTADIKLATQATGSTGNADPPNVDGGSAQDWLAMVHATVDLLAAGSSISAAPTNYTTGAFLNKSAATTTSVGIGVAYRQLSAAQTENPGTFTNTSGQWQAKTLLIPPAQPQSFALPVAALTVAGVSPTVAPSSAVSLTVGTAALTLAGVSPVIEQAWQTFSEGVSTNPYTTVTGLTNGVTYEFRVAAINALGTGPWVSPTATATPSAAGPQSFNLPVAALTLTGVSPSAAGSSPATLTVSTATLTIAGVAVTLSLPVTVLVPTSISGAHLLDQNGDPIFIRTFSSWALNQNLSDADITAALEDVAASGAWNSVTATFGGPQTEGTGWVKHKNAANQDFWTGTPWASSLGAAWASVDHMLAEAERLGLFVNMSLFSGWNGDEGDGNAWAALTDQNLYDAGVAIATRYADTPNIIWHVELDSAVGPSNTIGQRVEAFFHGVNDTEDPPRVVRWLESENEAGTTHTQDEWGWDLNTGYFAPSITTGYSYTDSSVVEAELWRSVAGSGPFGDAESSYDGAGRTSAQNLRERIYAVIVEGGCLLNSSHEQWWCFGKTGLFSGDIPGGDWTDVFAHNHVVWMGYAWSFLDEHCRDVTWAPSAFVNGGEGTGGSKAASGNSDTRGVAYFPDSRASITVNTSLLAGTGNVKLRWYDPTLDPADGGSYTTISASEAQNASRSVTHPGNNAQGDGDWVLLVELLQPPEQTFTLPVAALTVTGVSSTLAGSGSTTVTLTTATLTLAGVAPSLNATGSATAAVPVAALAATGVEPALAPSGAASLTAPVAALTLTGVQPALTGGPVSFAVPVATLTLTGVAPTVTTGGASFALPVATLTLAGVAPDTTATGATALTVETATLTVSGLTPSLAPTGAAAFALPTANLTTTGEAIVVAGTGVGTLTAPVAALTLTGVTIDVSAGAPPAGGFTLAVATITLVGIAVGVARIPSAGDAPIATSDNNEQVPLSWTAPNDGNSPITDYIVQYRVKP